MATKYWASDCLINCNNYSSIFRPEKEKNVNFVSENMLKKGNKKVKMNILF